MVIAIKQPLRLADNLSAFDPEIPLIVSEKLQNQLLIPIADMSAVSNSKTIRAKLVKGFSHRDLTGRITTPKNVETITQSFSVSGERFTMTFSQEVQFSFAWITAGGGTAYGRWLSSLIPERETQTLQVNTPYVLNRRGISIYMKMTGTFVTALCRLDGYY